MRSFPGSGSGYLLILSLKLEGVANSLGGTHHHDNCLGYAIGLLYDPGIMHSQVIYPAEEWGEEGRFNLCYHATLMPL